MALLVYIVLGGKNPNWQSQEVQPSPRSRLGDGKGDSVRTSRSLLPQWCVAQVVVLLKLIRRLQVRILPHQLEISTNLQT